MDNTTQEGIPFVTRKKLPSGYKTVITESGSSVNVPTTGGVFADPRYDLPFKLVFGEEDGADHFTGLVNSILKRVKLPLIEGSGTYRDRENNGNTLGDKQIRMDTNFMDNIGRVFNVEMQKDSTGPLPLIIRRVEFYHGRNIASKKDAQNAKHLYNFKPVITILITNYILEEKWPLLVSLMHADPSTDCITLDSQNGDKVICLQLPKFKKEINELNDDFDLYLYLLVHMGSMLEIPKEFDNDKFRPIFEKLRIKKINKKDMEQYAISEKEQLANEYKIENAREQGLEKGKDNTLNLILELLRRKDPKLPSVDDLKGMSMAEIEALHQSLTN